MTSSATIISGGTIYTTRMRLDGGSVVVTGRHISDVHAGGERFDFPEGAEVIDASGHIVAPGFIDVHVHGGGGGDTSQADGAGVRMMAEAHARFGTTAMLPTVYPGPRGAMSEAIDAVTSAMGASAGGGARIIGVNMEGPFLSPRRAGALHAESFLEPTIERLESLVAASGGNIRMMTIAPELPGAIPVIKACRERSIRTAVGHSDASYEEMVLGVNAGINHVTHVFNAMRGTHHRDPGVMGTVLVNDEITVELIADLYHVHPAVMLLLIKVKPNDKIVLATDSVKMTGLAGDIFEADGRQVRIVDGLARLSDGTIAGSILTMNRAVANVVSTGLVPLEDALKMASLVPAKILGIEHTQGTLTPGSDADIVVLDEDFNVKLTMVEGEVVYRAEGF